MSEYPTRTCGTCEQHGKYEKVAEVQGDYLDRNTVPKPELVHKDKVTLNKHSLAVPSTYYPADLGVPATKSADKIKPPLGFENVPPVRPKREAIGTCGCVEQKDVLNRAPCPDSMYNQLEYRDSALELPLPQMAKNINAEKKRAKQTEHAVDDQPPIPIKPRKGILKQKEKCPCEEESAEAKAVKGGGGGGGDEVSKKEYPKPPQTKMYEEIVVDRECYLPKPEDDFPEQRDDPAGNLGPWATGRVDWGPLAGLTGVRPVVDKYSISRFSEGEWRTHNKKVLDTVTGEQHRANLLEYNSNEAIEHARTYSDKNQADSTRRLYQREQELHRWKCELERAITAADEEIALMQDQRRRLKQSMAVLQLPESIAGECLDRRTGRLDSELVRDEVEEELIKEMALTAEIREQFTRTLADVEHQLLEDKTAKNRLEYDWSDKKQANEIECVNVALNNHSTILLFKPGAVGFPDHQSTQEQWEKFTRETLEESEITRQRSVALRGTLDAILQSAAKNLRAQADRVDIALAKRISCMEEVRTRFENELKGNLKRLADIETTVLNLKQMVRRMDTPLKKVQTRLDNRVMYRPRIENCRDPAHYGLVEEVKMINDNVSQLMSQLKQAEDTQNALMMTRSVLEREIMVKRKTLEIDRDRIQLIRSHYPSATALSVVEELVYKWIE